jgi:predicted ATPase
MLLALGASLRATKGSGTAETQQTYTRARQLCKDLEDPYHLFPVLHGLWNYYQIRAEYQTAHALGEQLLALAQQAQDATMLVAAHAALERTLFHLGAIASAQTHFAQGIALYDPQQHRAAAFLYMGDAGVICHIYGARALWCLGYPDQGLARNEEAVTLAQHLAYPFSLSLALGHAAIFHQFRREWRRAQDRAEASLNLAKEQGFPLYMAVSAILHGWALAHQGRVKEGIEEIHQGLRAFQATSAETARPYYLSLLAEAHEIIGHQASGLIVLKEALALVDKTGERWCESELYRLKGELLLQQSSDNQVEAEDCFHQAIDIAQSQQAKSFELRAATSLARLWQQQGKRAKARQVLGDIYNWFTEGFDTADLQEAKALLEVLSQFSFEAIYGMISLHDQRGIMREQDDDDQFQRGPFPRRDHSDGRALVYSVPTEHASRRRAHGRTGGGGGSRHDQPLGHQI